MDTKTILIVDDSAVVLKALALQLKDTGYKVMTATDGGTALELARSVHPDLVVMDINFPPDVGHGGGVAWDGFKIIEWMRRMCGADRTPIIVITSDDIARHRTAVKAAGALTVLQKPVSKEMLLVEIDQAFRQASSAPPVEESLPTLRLAGS